MTNSMKRNPRGGRGPKVVLYTLGILIAVMAGILIKTTASSDTAKSAKLTSFSPLTVAPISDQSAATGAAIVPFTPTATDTQTVPYPVVTWAAENLPPGITIQHSTGLLSGTPTQAGTFAVIVTAKDNSHPPTYGSTRFTWTIGNNAPIITQVVPVQGDGAGGIRVVISGSNFQGATSVTFGDLDAGGLTVNHKNNKIVVYAPQHAAGTVDIRVTALGGTSDITPSDAFTYLAPKVNFVANSTGLVGGGTHVQISGSGLTGATSVSFGGVPAVQFSVKRHGTLVTAIAPPGAVGSVGITVVTPGGSTDSGVHRFTYAVAPPKTQVHRVSTTKNARLVVIKK